MSYDKNVLKSADNLSLLKAQSDATIVRSFKAEIYLVNWMVCRSILYCCTCCQYVQIALLSKTSSHMPRGQRLYSVRAGSLYLLRQARYRSALKELPGIMAPPCTRIWLQHLSLQECWSKIVQSIKLKVARRKPNLKAMKPPTVSIPDDLDPLQVLKAIFARLKLCKVLPAPLPSSCLNSRVRTGRASDSSAYWRRSDLPLYTWRP